jgi:hypothetical protein
MMKTMMAVLLANAVTAEIDVNSGKVDDPETFT